MARQTAYYCPDTNQLQVVEENYNGYEVYNFRDAIDPEEHSHIHYDRSGDPSSRTIYRDLSNPENYNHVWYGSTSSAITVRHGDFPFIFEALKLFGIDSLSKEQLVLLKQYLEEAESLSDEKGLSR